MARGAAKRCPVLPSSHGVPGGWWWEPPGWLSPAPCPRAALGAQHPWISLQVLIPPGQDSTPVFRAPHILLMTYGLSGGSRQEVGWTLLRETWILIEKPSFIQSKERKKKPQLQCLQAGSALLCSAINRRCLFYTNLLHHSTESRSRFLRVWAISALVTCADASGLCLGSFGLLWYVELLSDNIFQAGMLREEEMKGVGC